MNRAHYIAGDWGTCRLRLSLCLDGRSHRALSYLSGLLIGSDGEPCALAGLRTLWQP
jgi:2-keto-3-deoxy-galactonokinase